MCEHAYCIVQELGKMTYVKVPVVKEVLKAIKQLHQEGILVKLWLSIHLYKHI